MDEKIHTEGPVINSSCEKTPTRTQMTGEEANKNQPVVRALHPVIFLRVAQRRAMFRPKSRKCPFVRAASMSQMSEIPLRSSWLRSLGTGTTCRCRVSAALPPPTVPDPSRPTPFTIVKRWAITSKTSTKVFYRVDQLAQWSPLVVTGRRDPPSAAIGTRYFRGSVVRNRGRRSNEGPCMHRDISGLTQSKAGRCVLNSPGRALVA